MTFDSNCLVFSPLFFPFAIPVLLSHIHDTFTAICFTCIIFHELLSNTSHKTVVFPLKCLTIVLLIQCVTVFTQCAQGSISFVSASI